MKKTGVERRTIGVNFDSDGKATVSVWSPKSASVSLCLEHKELPLQKDPYGYWRLATTEIKPGDAYTFSINGEKGLPDPAALSQPGGVHEASAAVDVNRF